METVQDTAQSAYQVIITGITWSKKTSLVGRAYRNSKYEDLPTQFTLDVPQSKLNEANKKTNVFNDVIESYCYDFLTRKFGHEVSHCQIWLPL